MNLKIDTKERFQVVTLQEDSFTATMSVSLQEALLPFLQQEANNSHPGNIVLVMNQIKSIDEGGADFLAVVQQKFYQQGRSFVICGLQKEVEQFLAKRDLLETMNYTPSESEAWDIVQMEEIERELGEDN